MTGAVTANCPVSTSTATQIEATATALGLGYRYTPVVSGQFRDEDVASFDTALTKLEAPILAFCRTGTRATALWALSAAAETAAAEDHAMLHPLTLGATPLLAI